MDGVILRLRAELVCNRGAEAIKTRIKSNHMAASFSFGLIQLQKSCAGATAAARLRAIFRGAEFAFAFPFPGFGVPAARSIA